MLVRQFVLQMNTGADVNPVIHANQYDEGELWCFTILNGTKVIQPDESTLIGLSSDGKTYAVNGYVDDLGRACITEIREITSSPGRGEYELTIGGHGTANFYVQVEERPIDGAVISDDEINYFQQLVNQTGENATNAANSANEAADAVRMASSFADFNERTEVFTLNDTDLFAIQPKDGNEYNSVRYYTLASQTIFNHQWTVGSGHTTTIAEAMNKALSKDEYTYLTGTSLSVWNTVGDEITLNKPRTDFTYIIFRLGSDTDQSSGGGATFVWIPGFVSNNNMFSLMYWLNGAVHQITARFISDTKVKIVAVASTGTLASGIRAVYGIR